MATGAALLITTLLWALAKFMGIRTQGLLPWGAATQLSGLWSVTLMSMAMIAVTRAQALDPLFGGLDRATRFHRVVGPAAVLLMVLHPLFLIVDGFPVSMTLVPFSDEETRSLDIIAFYLILILTALAYVGRLGYERWTNLHRPIGLLFLVGAVNASILEPGTSASFEPLRTWIVILILGGAFALLYRVVLFQRFGGRYEYKVQTLDLRPDESIDLVMRPVHRRMMYEPGTFVFLRVRALRQHARELHPFSISSSPVERDLRLSIKMVGDFTRSLATLPVGLPIDIYGPFGGFTPHRFAQYKRLVLVGAGIGITPFLSMLAFEASNNEFRRIWLYYVVRTADQAPYHAEIQSRFINANSFIDYILWTSADQGRITAAAILENVLPLDNFAVMLCGRPEFVSAMASQFQQAGVPAERIISESFLFR